jgi:pyridoxal phosphate enzyme (YggS family)
MSIADNLRRVRERIAAAAQSCGRTADEITLVGVTKYVGPSEAAELVAAGCHDLGESRPQELWHKHDELMRAGGLIPPVSNVRWHLVGHLQRNKVRRTLPMVSLIHSVDSERLLAAINEVAASGEGEGAPPSRWSAEPPLVARQEPRLPVRILLEVNTSCEAAKHGLAPDDVAPLLAAASQFPHVRICGLMTMAALEGGPDVAARNFATLRELRDRLKRNTPNRVVLDELSMGMSGDFEVAIREGATIIRVGSALWD